MAPDPSVRRRRIAGFLRLGGPWTSACITLLLLGGVAWEVRGRDQSADAVAYHQRIRGVADSAIPYSAGDWLGHDVECPPAAIDMLHPNVLTSRAFANVRTGEVASLLFVQCSDARDLLGHYPPVCYVAHGMTLVSREARDWTVGGVEIHGMRYHFGNVASSSSSGTVIDNFMALPTGKFGRDMEDVSAVAKDRRLRQFGAAQVQLLTDESMTDARRDEVVRELIEPIVPLLRCISARTGHANER